VKHRQGVSIPALVRELLISRHLCNAATAIQIGNEIDTRMDESDWVSTGTGLTFERGFEINRWPKGPLLYVTQHREYEDNRDKVVKVFTVKGTPMLLRDLHFILADWEVRRTPFPSQNVGPYDIEVEEIQ
jgi:hypothetical protein